MRTVAANEHIQQRIRFLMQRQHDHERQWWKGREALVQKQKSRTEKKKELDEVLYVSSFVHAVVLSYQREGVDYVYGKYANAS
jgi:Mn-containing catalase